MEPIRPKSNVLYIPPSQPLHDLDVTVRVIETQNHVQVHLSGGAASLLRTCQKL